MHMYLCVCVYTISDLVWIPPICAAVLLAGEFTLLGTSQIDFSVDFVYL